MIFATVLSLLAYLALTFVFSAVIVRLWPRSRISRRLRLNLGMFVFLPFMLLAAVLHRYSKAFKWLSRRPAALFTCLSGRRQYQRIPYSTYMQRRGRRETKNGAEPTDGHRGRAYGLSDETAASGADPAWSPPLATFSGQGPRPSTGPTAS